MTGNCTCNEGYVGSKCDLCLNSSQSLIQGIGCVGKSFIPYYIVVILIVLDVIKLSGSFVLDNLIYQPNLMDNNKFVSFIHNQLTYRLGQYSILTDFGLDIVPS
jgi:hypothetical protein